MAKNFMLVIYLIALMRGVSRRVSPNLEQLNL